MSLNQEREGERDCYDIKEKVLGLGRKCLAHHILKIPNYITVSGEQRKYFLGINAYRGVVFQLEHSKYS